MSRRRDTTPRSGRRACDARPAVAARVDALDALRGVAIVAMICYHFSFDLRYFGLTQWDFYRDPFWLNARTMILSSFLLIAGVSLVLAERNRPIAARFWRHVGTIGACALIVSAASYAMFPASWIWFGVLHAIAVSLLLARPLVRHPVLALVIGAAVIAAGQPVRRTRYSTTARWGWIGFMTAKPRTEDYVPLFPWTGVLLLGIGLPGMRWCERNSGPLVWAATLPRWLAWLGRHSLAAYMVHQPLLFGCPVPGRGPMRPM